MSNHVIVALDVPQMSLAQKTAEAVAPHVAGVKIGKQLFTAEGPEAVRSMQRLGVRVFLDLKFHDIPNTVAGAVSSASGLGVWMVNVHASGGPTMMKAAAEAAARTDPRPIVLAVTVLTSFRPDEFQSTLGTAESIPDAVARWARLAQVAGLDGVVASPHEIEMIRKACGPKFLIVTPGVRPKDAALNDQQRVMRPGEAIRAGADYVVIGRPILEAKVPADAAKRIAEECRTAAAERY